MISTDYTLAAPAGLVPNTVSHTAAVYNTSASNARPITYFDGDVASLDLDSSVYGSSVLSKIGAPWKGTRDFCRVSIRPTRSGAAETIYGVREHTRVKSVINSYFWMTEPSRDQTENPPQTGVM